MSDLCHTGPADFNMELSTDADELPTSPSKMNKFPIVPMILPIGRTWNLLSMVLLFGILFNLQTCNSLSLYGLMNKK